MTPARFLTADLGNSALKLVVWELERDAPPRPVERSRIACGEGAAAGLEAWLAARHSLGGAALSSVAGREPTQRVATLLAARAPLAAPPPWGGRTDCREPERVGEDRLFAVRGAWELLRGPALVADAGSALNVEVLAPDPQAPGPRHRGGAIAPGPRLLASALASGGARLLEVEPEPGVPALGRDTREALAAGVAHGFTGAARRLVELLAAEAGLAEAPLVVTGGAQQFLVEPGLFPGREVLVRPDLVHEGLLAAGTGELLGATWRAAPAR